MRSLNSTFAAAYRGHCLTMACNALVCTMGLLIAAPVLAIADSARFSIAAQPLPAALRVFAAQAHMQLLYRYKAVANTEANAIDGEMEKRAALNELLKDTGLEAVFSSDTAATIRPIHASTSQSDSSEQSIQTANSAQREVTSTSSGQGLSAAIPVNANAQSTASSPENQLNEVVVTATKRSESLTVVPISITALNPGQLALADVNNVADLQRIVPGFSLNFNGSNAQPNIRGVSAPVSGLALGPNIASYQDGFYQPNPTLINVDFPDIASVQVLKGPQGELYGQNATGGAIILTTKDPSSKPSADFDLSYRSYNDVRLGVFATGPIAQDLAGSISLYGARADDYERNVATGQRGDGSYTERIRLKLLYQPTDDLRFLLSASYANISDPNTYNFSDYKNEADGRLPPFNGISAPSPDTFATIVRPLFKANAGDVGLKTTADLPWGTLTSLSYGQWSSNQNDVEEDGTTAKIDSVDYPEVYRNFSQELDLASRTGASLQWLLGAVYFHDDEFDVFNESYPAVVPSLLTGGVVVHSEALYGDATYNVWNNLFLTAGLRYSHDELHEYFESGPYFVPYTQADTGFVHWSPRFVARYDVDDRSNIYASYSTGYKRGAFNALGLSTVPVKPETITAYEVGYKRSDRGYHVEAAAFYYDYSNLQVNQFLEQTTILVNAAKARIYGAELGGGLNFLEHFTLEGGLSYVHARYLSFPNAPAEAWCPPSAAPCTANNVEGAPGGRQTFPAGIEDYPGNAAGNPLTNSPDFSAKLNLIYQHELPVGSMVLSSNVAYQTAVYFDFFKQVEQPAYVVANLSASWLSPDHKYDLSVFCDNVGNEAYINSGFVQPIVFTVHYAPPRVVGVRFKVHL